MTRAEAETEARRRFLWMYPPASDRDDARDAEQAVQDAARGKKPKKPRDWKPTRDAAIEQILREAA